MLLTLKENIQKKPWKDNTNVTLNSFEEWIMKYGNCQLVLELNVGCSLSRVDDYHRCAVLRKKLQTRRNQWVGVSSEVLLLQSRQSDTAGRVFIKNLLQVLTTNAHPGIVNIFSETIPFPSGRLWKKKQNQREPKAYNILVKTIILEDI